MPSKIRHTFFLIIITIIALVFRLPQLSERPMHGDEAVNAIKYAHLLETGKYEYNPVEYHGPSLYYFTLPISWISGISSLEDLNESVLRLIPVIFGLGLILLLNLVKPYIGWKIPLYSGLIIAISPAFVFFSRYYIHEILLVFFCYLFMFSVYNYIESNKGYWSIISGFALGLLISTKETWILLLFSMLISFAIIFLIKKETRAKMVIYLKSIHIRDAILFLSALLITIILLYSAFFSSPEGLQNFISAFSGYIDRAGNNPIHNHFWYMYFKWLLFFSYTDGSFWSEGIIAVLALFGFVGILSKGKETQGTQNFLRFFLLFVTFTTIIFSLIPYKTPWNFLTFWFGYIFLAGVGISYLYSKLIKKSYRLILTITLAISFGHLGWQSYQLAYTYSSNVNNPFVYAHPGRDVFKITDKLEQIALHHAEGYQIHIQIYAKGSDYWPLPWYLRKFQNVGWWNEIDYESQTAPIIIFQPELMDKMLLKLYEIPPPGERHLYLPLFEDYTELRPGKELEGYIRKDYWDSLINADK